MAGIVDIDFQSSFLDKNTANEMNKYIEQLEKIESLQDSINNPKGKGESEAEKKQKTILKIAKQTLEIEKQLSLARKGDNQELLNTLNYMKRQLSSGEALSSLQLKTLDYVKTNSKLKAQQEAEDRKILETEVKRLSLLDDLRHKIKMSTTEKELQYKITKKIDDLEKNVKSEDFAAKLKSIKQEMDLEKKKLSNAKAVKKQQIDLEKQHYRALQINKKMDLDKEKSIMKQKEALKRDFFKTELELIKNNRYHEYKASIESIKNSKLEVKEKIKQFEKLKETMQMDFAKQQGKKSKFTEDLSQMMGLRQLSTLLKRNVGELERFEDSVMQMGIISGRSSEEIGAMRGEMYQLGLDIPRATQALVKNIAAVERTGRTYEEAMEIVKKSASLAVVSGESLTDSVNVLNKAMKAFNIGIEETANVMDILHSSTLTTPLDLQAISDGMKNSASAMRNFIEATDRSGKELEDYKIKILELNTALIGNQMQLGEIFLLSINFFNCWDTVRAS